METITQPNYKQIFSDIILHKFPDKMEKCKSYLTKKNLTELDILTLNDYLFPKTNAKISLNQKHKSYHISTILEILEFQRLNGLNNIRLAQHYNLSRNTVTRWKKLFLNKLS